MNSLPTTSHKLEFSLGNSVFIREDGDIFGREGTLGTASSDLKNTEMATVSRRHLRLHWNPEKTTWMATLLPTAQNPTRIDSEFLSPGQSIALGIGSHAVSILNFHCELRVSPSQVEAPKSAAPAVVEPAKQTPAVILLQSSNPVIRF